LYTTLQNYPNPFTTNRSKKSTITKRKNTKFYLNYSLHIYKSPYHILVAHKLSFVLFIEVIQVPTSATIKEYTCITAIS